MGNRSSRMKEPGCFDTIFSKRKIHHHGKRMIPGIDPEPLVPAPAPRSAVDHSSPAEPAHRTARRPTPITMPPPNLPPADTLLMYHDVTVDQRTAAEDCSSPTEIPEEDMRIINDIIAKVVYDNLFRP